MEKLKLSEMSVRRTYFPPKMNAVETQLSSVLCGSPEDENLDPYDYSNEID